MKPLPRWLFTLMCLLTVSAVMMPSSRPALCDDADALEKAVRRARQAGATTQPADAGRLGKGDLYALVVGVAQYKKPSVPKLGLSDKDARAFADFLRSQKTVFRNTNVEVLTNERATKQAIEKGLEYDLMKAGKDDTVVLYFSGHGADDPKKPGEYFFLGYDADPDYLKATSVKMSGLGFLKNIDARRVLVIVDACHAGSTSKFGDVRTKALDKSLASLLRQFRESAGKVILTSSKPNEYSQEKPSLSNSVFTHYLLRALAGEADSDRDGIVALKEAYDYVYDRTRTETGGAQHPQLEGKLVGDFPLAVLKDLRNPVKLEVRFIAQDPRCKNKRCTDPPPGVTECSDPLCKDVSIGSGDTMYSGQNFQIALRTAEAAYIYAYYLGADGEIFKLFPGDDFLAADNRMKNPLKGGEIHWIPAKNQWLRQDDKVGEERIYVVASRNRNEILEDLYGHIQRLRENNRSPGRTRLAQKAMTDYMDRTMGPTRRLVRKVEHSGVAGADDEKIRNFEMLSQIFQSSSLEAVESIQIRHKSRK